jgi:hypothetical protein
VLFSQKQAVRCASQFTESAYAIREGCDKPQISDHAGKTEGLALYSGCHVSSCPEQSFGYAGTFFFPLVRGANDDSPSLLLNLSQTTLPSFTLRGVRLSTLLPTLKPFVVVSKFFIWALTQHEWFRVDGGFSARGCYELWLSSLQSWAIMSQAKAK